MDLVLTEKRGPVGIITMNQPERLNPMSTYPGGSEDQLLQAMLEMEGDEDVRAVILTGAGRAFCAGADRKTALSHTSYTLDQRVSRALAEPTTDLREETSHAIFVAFDRYSKPIIAAVNGLAIGGGWSLALHCDIIIVDETARFRVPFVELGLTSGSGALMAASAAGPYQTADILLTARWFTAQEAKEMGLVSRIVPQGTSLEEAVKVAQVIASHPPLAVTVQKHAIRRAISSPDAWRLSLRESALLSLTQQAKDAQARSGQDRGSWAQAFPPQAEKAV